MKDPILALAEQRLLEDALDVSVQLEKGSGTRPVLWLLKDARVRAAEAMHALTQIDPHKWRDIRALQNEVALYSDMVASCQKLLMRGKEADREIDEQERAEFSDLLTPEQAREMGVPQIED